MKKLDILYIAFASPTFKFHDVYLGLSSRQQAPCTGVHKRKFCFERKRAYSHSHTQHTYTDAPSHQIDCSITSTNMSPGSSADFSPPPPLPLFLVIQGGLCHRKDGQIESLLVHFPLSNFIFYFSMANIGGRRIHAT